MGRASLVGLTLLLVVFALSLMPAVARAQTPASSYVVISLDNTIDPGAQDFVASAISSAQSAGATHFVLILNTFGGDGQSMDNIVQAISSFESGGGTFITLIGPFGAHAFSAGAYISESSTEIYMMNGTVIGSATPIVSGIPTGETNTTLTKDIDGFTSYMQALTANFGRNATATGLMVSNGVSYTDTQALSLHVVNGVLNASSLSAALTQLGVPSGASVQNEGTRSDLISIVSDPNLSSVLFLAGVLAIMIDLYHPTFILSAAGAASIVLAMIGFGYFGAPLSAIILMFIGALFIFLEVKTHHGVSAIGGVVLFIIGVLLVYQVPVSTTPSGAPLANFTGPSPLTYGTLAFLAFAVVAGSIYLYRVRKDLMKRNKGRFDLQNMIGKEGVLTSDVKAGMVGSANIDSEDWTVTAAVDLAKGARVKVKEVQGFTLTVEGI